MAYNQIFPQVQQPDLGNTLRTVAALRQADNTNELAKLQRQEIEQKIADRTTTRNALSRLASGDTSARTELMGTPGGLDLLKTLDADKKAKLAERAATANSILSLPADQRDPAYQQVRAQAAQNGEDISKWPQAWDDRVGQSLVAMGATLDQQLKIAEGHKPTVLGEGATAIDNQGNVIARGAPKTHTLAPGGTLIGSDGRPMFTAPDRTQPPLAIPDANSPTGFRYVPRDQAVGQPAMGPSGMSVDFDPETGRVRSINSGPGASKGASGNGFGTAGNNELDKQLVEMTGLLSQVATINRTFDPNNQKVGTKLQMALAVGKDRLGELDPQTQADLAEYTTQRADAGQLYAERLKTMAGSAVTPEEAKKQEVYLPTPGSDGLLGIFDGDSPTQFAAKAKRMEQFFQKATARLYYIKQKGLSIKDVPLDKMPDIIRTRGNELAAQYGRQGLKDDAVKAAVKQQLSNEFGLVAGQ